MSTIVGPPQQIARLDRTLEYAVAQSWDELMPNSTSGLIHIEYQTGEDGSVDFLKVWASTVRGHWNLVCELWMRPLWSHTTGLRFANNFKSPDFARALELVMGHESSFLKLSDRQGTIQVYPPSDEERERSWTEMTFGHLAAILPEPQTAA